MDLIVHQTQGQVPVTVLAIDGKLDGSNYQELIDRVNGLYKSGTRSLLLDLTNLIYMSSSGVVALHSIAVLLHSGALPNLDNGWAALNAVAEESGGLRKQVKLLTPKRGSTGPWKFLG